MNINVQKLFIAAVFLKLATLAVAWLINDPWIVGLLLPLSVMVAYFLLGYRYRENSVSDEKFADSCYYLGFIFTIATIIVILFDLEKVGSNLYTIIPRFAAAMLSTLIGVIARIVIIGFKQDSSEAIQQVEQTILESSEKLIEQINSSIDKFKLFEAEVIEVTEKTASRVELQLEKITQDYSNRINDFFDSNATRLNELFDNCTTKFVDSLSDMQSAYKNFNKSTTLVSKNLDILNDKLENLYNDINAQRTDLASYNVVDTLKNINDGSEKLLYQLQSNSGHYDELKNAMNKGTELISYSLNSLKDLAPLGNKIDELSSELTNSALKISSSINSLNNLEALSSKLDDLVLELNKNTLEISTSLRPLESLQDFSDKINELKNTLSEQGLLLKNSHINYFDGVSNDFYDVINKIEKNIEKLVSNVQSDGGKDTFVKTPYMNGKETLEKDVEEKSNTFRTSLISYFRNKDN